MTAPFRVLAAVLFCVPALAADEGPHGPTYTSPLEAGEDFDFQGEFLGWQRPQGTHRSTQRIGLQVISRGDGEFLAVKHLGGLPGDGGHRRDQYLYDGRRLGAGVFLLGDITDLRVHFGHADVLTKDGRTIGRLERVYRESPTLGVAPPEGAVVLFDGDQPDRLRDVRLTDEGWLAVGAETSDRYRSFRMHGEFLLPYQPKARGQARANSGFYLQNRYEVQVLDSFGLEGVENECAALYRQRAPDENLCLPPLVWQTYDIDFTAAEFAGGERIAPARISLWHNGVPVHRDVEITGKTGAGQPEGADAMPIRFQDHGNPVVFRNLWIIDTTDPAAREIDWLDLPLRAAPMPIAHWPPPCLCSPGR
ncbi:MAG: DUF1080 domain-containing protein [Planctomyces sp.]|nr:DUF1080 domain-containing protein [Planctomyces sp.]